MASLPTVLLAACTALLALVAPLLAGDPDMLQDFCVAEYKSLEGPLRVNGFPCKRPENVTANDFFSDVLSLPGNTGNPVGSAVTAVNVDKLPGLNTLGMSISRVDYAPWGVNPPHTHPRATEIIFMVEGSLTVGFVTTAGNLFTRTVCKGELFVFPHGLVHFQRNNGGTPAMAISAFNSQLPGIQSVAVSLSRVSPSMPTDVLARAFQINAGMVEALNSNSAPMY
ncbi:hypothetical protein QYE76_058091 [Lolium multiflorum]|uniref:Germin-like protein n=1 Tax=Lolium multiflorum TaxID=4521 RepID=A0AAD8T509_LOLMU|nr:hypothetical protein QYE76_058091 [Lolium multiflorum]